jgi:hypothetical protein
MAPPSTRLLVKIKGELGKLKPILGPTIELEFAGEPQPRY